MNISKAAIAQSDMRSTALHDANGNAYDCAIKTKIMASSKKLGGLVFCADCLYRVHDGHLMLYVPDKYDEVTKKYISRVINLGRVVSKTRSGKTVEFRTVDDLSE